MAIIYPFFILVACDSAPLLAYKKGAHIQYSLLIFVGQGSASLTGLEADPFVLQLLQQRKQQDAGCNPSNCPSSQGPFTLLVHSCTMRKTLYSCLRMLRSTGEKHCCLPCS